MSSYLLVCVLLVSSICTTYGAWNDCGEALNSEVPRFTQFALFNNPIHVGETIHARAVVSLTGISAGAITGGTIYMVVGFNGAPAFALPAISLCNSTSSIACASLTAGDNAFSFDFVVPKIPAGTYKITLSIYPTGLSKPGCVSFDVTVADPTSTNVYTSWIEASLAGVAQFSLENYTLRDLKDPIQVGPIGLAPKSKAANYQWGSFLKVVGSEDVVDPDFVPDGYVWGLNGNMTALLRGSDLRPLYQTYTGSFYLGYVSNMNQRYLDTEIIEGEFSITWYFTYLPSGEVKSTLQGNIYFDVIAVLPLGWRAPVTVGRLGMFSLYTNSEGIIMVNASRKYCLTTTPCDFSGVGVAPGQDGLSDNDIAIMVSLLVGIPLIAALIGATILYVRHKRRHEEEAGIFSAARKPEYGNALVIDDIIQESRDHTGSLIPQLERRPGDTDSDYSDNEETELARTPRSGGGGGGRPGSARGSAPGSSRRGARERSPSPPPDYSDDDYDEEPEIRRRSPRTQNVRPASRSSNQRDEHSNDDDDSESYESDGSSASRSG